MERHMPSQNPLFRACAIAGFASLAGVVALSIQPQRFAMGEGDSRIVQPQLAESEQRARFLRASFIKTEADQIAAARVGANCKPGDVSAAEMEIILQEMIRRGWQPPSRVSALADLRMNSGSALFPLDPEQPMPRRWSAIPETTEDGPIPPTPPEELQSGEPVTVTSPVTQPTAPSSIKPSPAPAQPSASELIATPRPSPN